MIRGCLFAFLIAIGFSGAAVRAAEGWTFTVIATDTASTRNPISINDDGVVAFSVREPLSGGLERGSIRLSDGITTTILYETAPYNPNESTGGSQVFSVQRIGVNNSGDVVFWGFRRGDTSVGLFRVQGGQVVPIDTSPYLVPRGAATVNDSNQTVFRARLAGGGLFEERVVTANSDGTMTDTHVFFPILAGGANASPLPAINKHGDTAITAFELVGGGIGRVRFRLARQDGQIEDSILAVGSGSIALEDGGVALNDLRFGARVVTDDGVSQRALLIVPQGIDGIPAGVTEIARSGGSIASLNRGIALSNTNAVAFSGVEASGGGNAFFIAVKDVGQEPVIVVRQGEPLTPGGPPMALQPNNSEPFVYPEAMNDRGEIVFRALMAGIGEAIVRATPVDGLLSPRPILPAPEDVLPDEGWRFGGGATGGVHTYYDPPVASGYVFTAEDDTLRFSHAVVPAPLPGGDASFAVEFNGATEPLVAGQSFAFEAFAPGGVSSFRITGIDLAEAIDPADSAAFVVGLSFVEGAADDATFTMVPIVENTDDFDGDGVIASQDNCPAVFNTDQADFDGDGVGNLCDNCPSAANPTQADGDGNGIGDACEVVVARVCSVDADGDIDRNDISLITAARNQAASGSNDPRDVDLNRIINVNDARACTLRCDRPACAPQ